MNPKRNPKSQITFHDVCLITAKTGINAMNAKGHTPFADMNPGEAIERTNAEATKTTTSEQNVLRLYPALIDAVLSNVISPHRLHP